ncbi:MAG: phosphatidylinositol alpha 1,6-mannosyltransferase [Frankiales bacterium]|jgi:phosphatidylinositol alpha 1,6-mannosyltransferase|nr:phosphatidylinositol alpha 1,6-mannosyltransferase [Frankiales bacterium]
MRVAVITESFLPQVNGVTNSVLRVCEQLTQRGHEALVIAPGPGPVDYQGVPVIRTPSFSLPGYRDFRVARPWGAMTETLRSFDPDVVHLASPVALGAQGAFVARRLGVPVVAVYQTDLAGFASRYHLGSGEMAIWSWLRTIHDAAARTLAPSRAAVDQLQDNGVERVTRWARGVDLRRFHPGRRDRGLRTRFAPDGQVVIGYVGRLAHEKELALLAPVQDLPGARLVIAGDGPARKQLERLLPRAEFLGFQSGAALATTFASLDVFVHPGSHETFCQAAQEALSSGVPLVGPRAGGLLDLVVDGHNGLSFAPGSQLDLAEQVGRLVADPLLRRRLRGQARLSVQGRSWDVIGSELVGHYQEVLAA